MGKDGSCWRCGHKLLKSDQTHYCTYIGLEEFIPSAERIIASSEHPDEPQFKIVHVLFELAFRHHILELRRAIRIIGGKAGEAPYREAAKVIERITYWITTIYLPLMRILTTQMTPKSFFEFRNRLFPASGLESEGFREIELLSGITETTIYGMREYVGDKTYEKANAIGYWQYREVLDRIPENREGSLRTQLWTDHLTRVAVEANLANTFSEAVSKCIPETSYEAALELLFHAHEHAASGIHMLAEALHQYDVAMFTFRGTHLLVAQGNIGRLPGTAGLGEPYLASVAETVRFFPELWRVKNKPRVEWKKHPETGVWNRSLTRS